MMKTLIDDSLTLEQIESQRESDWQLFELDGLVSRWWMPRAQLQD